MDRKMLSEKLCYYFWDTPDIESTTASDNIPTALQYVSFALSVASCVIGLVGNVIVIYITGFKMKEKMSAIWFLNLAIADFVFLLVLPINAVSELKGNWSFGSHLCKAYHFLSNINMYASIFIITALNCDRVLSVSKPIWHHKFVTPRVCYITCTLIWVITTMASLPAAFWSNSYKIGEETQCLLGYIEPSVNGHNNIQKISDDNSNKFSQEISRNYSDDYSFIFPSTINFTREIIYGHDMNESSLENGLFHSAVPNLLKTIKYSFLMMFAENAYQRRPLYREQCENNDCCANEEELTTWNHMVFTTESLVIPLIVIGYFIPLCVIICSNFIIVLNVKKSKTVKSLRLYKIVITVVLAYFLSWTPLIIADIISLVAARNMNFPLILNINMILPLLTSIAYSNSCLNPIIYVLVGKNVRSLITNSMKNIREGFTTNSLFTNSNNTPSTIN